MKIKEISIRVKNILEIEPLTRDNDNLLLSMIWRDDVNSINPTLNEINIFFELLQQNKLTSFESCRRCRQLIQQTTPALRGSVYKTRHKKAESVKTELNEEKFPMILDSKYARITKEIFDTLKVGDKIYFTHTDVIYSDFLFNDIRYANNNFILGTKYTIVDKNLVALQILDLNNVLTYVAPSQFSILKK